MGQKSLLDPIVALTTERKDGNAYMYLFLAKYQHLTTGECRLMTIEIKELGCNEREVYLRAMNSAYENTEGNEFLASLEFVAC